MIKIIFVVLRKEWHQFFRNSFLPKLCLIFPLIVMLVIPLVANMDVKNVGVVVVDSDHSLFSRRIAAKINASEYLQLYSMPSNYKEAIRIVEKGNADVILEINAGFYRSVKNHNPQKLRLSANAVNATKGVMGLQYMQQVISSTLNEIGCVTVQEIEIEEFNLFNPILDYKHFMIPALMIILLIMLTGFLPVLNIVGEKERGTIEQINVSPLSQVTFTLGKVIPYWIIGLVVITIAIIVSALVYDLTPVGNIYVIYLATILFIIIMSGLAMILANFSDNMQQVMFVMFFFVMVFIIMSGLMTPIQSMPEWAQNITYVLPPRYFVDILRSTYLKGATLTDQLFSFAMLSGFALLFLSAAIFTYSKQQK